MEKKSIALIGSGILSKELATRAKELGIETHCFSFNEKDVACNYVDFFHKIDIFDTERITKICKDYNVNGIIPTTELTIWPASKIAGSLNLLGNSENVAREITNKYLTREKVKNVKHLFQPEYHFYLNGDIPIFNTYPLIVKPIAAGGKRGINVVYNQLELKDAIKYALPFSKVEGVLIESFLDGGKEYSVETLSYKNKHYITQITEKDTSGPPHCNELGHHQPAALTIKMKKLIKKVISDMLDAVGISNGPSHTEIKIVDEKIYLIEINDRPGGDHITYPLTELSTNYPYLTGIIKAAMGELEGFEPKYLKNYYAGIFFVTDKTPELLDIFNDCDSFSWCFHKNRVNDGVSKIEFNDEEGLNYFIYFDKEQDPSEFIKNYKRTEI